MAFKLLPRFCYYLLFCAIDHLKKHWISVKNHPISNKFTGTFHFQIVPKGTGVLWQSSFDPESFLRKALEKPRASLICICGSYLSFPYEKGQEYHVTQFHLSCVHPATPTRLSGKSLLPTVLPHQLSSLPLIRRDNCFGWQLFRTRVAGTRHVVIHSWGVIHSSAKCFSNSLALGIQQ